MLCNVDRIDDHRNCTSQDLVSFWGNTFFQKVRLKTLQLFKILSREKNIGFLKKRIEQKPFFLRKKMFLSQQKNFASTFLLLKSHEKKKILKEKKNSMCMPQQIISWFKFYSFLAKQNIEEFYVNFLNLARK